MMKHITFIVMLLAVNLASAQKAAKVKIVYFHSEHRCPTCISIEDNTRKALNTYFPQQLKDGTITLEVLNVDKAENLKMVEKYKAEGSALFITGISASKENTTDLTTFAFSYSRNQPEKFIAGLKAEIDKKLK